MIVTNAFSANMLAEFPASVNFTEIAAAEASHMLACIEADGDTWQSAVGHADTAAVMTAVLNDARQDGHVIACNRATVTLGRGDTALIGQYSGPRLPEGATKLPDGAAIKWIVVTVS